MATSEMKTIQTGAHQANNKKLRNYSLMLGGLNVTHEVLAQYDPLITGYGRLFMVRSPETMTQLLSDKFKNFKHILEYGNTQVQGLGDVSVDFQQITGGYAGRSFEIPSVAKDETTSFQVTCYEFSGSPIREVLHSWINTTTDLQSGLTHYGGLIASGNLEYSQAAHTAEFIYVVTDRTGMKVEYACLLANCFPKVYKNDQFNYQSGEHNFVETQIDFTCTKYESIDINEKAKILLKNYQIMVNSLEFYSGLDSDIVKGFESNATMYDSKSGELVSQEKAKDRFFVQPGTKNPTSTKFNSDGEKITPSYTNVGNDKNNSTGS